MRTMKFWERKTTLSNREFYLMLLQVLLQGECENSEIGIQILNSRDTTVVQCQQTHFSELLI